MRGTDVKFLADACGGRIIGNPDVIVKNIKIDSRACESGDMFVCIIGENNDGHDYILSAFDKGARVFLVSKQIDFPDATFILVEDTIKAFCKMAKAYLNQFPIRKVAVTGSVGKTTTKMLTAAVLSSMFNTICTQGNLNTDIGTSLTCFMVDEMTEAAVFEMGMDQKGQIKDAVSIVNPHLAIITNVGISHLEKLGSRDAIADAKLEIVSEFSSSDVLVVNSNSDYLKSHKEIRERALNKNKFHIVGVGSDITIDDIRSDEEKGIEFRIKNVEFSLPLHGEHNAVDAALAVACGIQFGIPIKRAAKALSLVDAAAKRFKIEKFGNIVLIDDSYNASPDSVNAGLKTIAKMKAQRKIAVLGDMLELGSESEAGHISVGKTASECGIDIVIAYGNQKYCYMKGIVNSGKTSCRFVPAESLDKVKQSVLDILQDGDVIYVKGSNSTKVSEVAEAIRERFEK